MYRRTVLPVALLLACSPERRSPNADGEIAEGEGRGDPAEGEGPNAEGANSAEGEGPIAEGGARSEFAEGEGASAEGAIAEGAGPAAEGEGAIAAAEGEGENAGGAIGGEGEAACQEPVAPSEWCDCNCRGARGMTTGTLEFVDLEGGCYVLQSNDGNFELVGPTAAEILNQGNVGTRYSISYQTCPDLASICQVGHIVCLRAYEVLDGECKPDEAACGAHCCGAGEQCCAGMPIPAGSEYCIASDQPGGCPIG